MQPHRHSPRPRSCHVINTGSCPRTSDADCTSRLPSACEVALLSFREPFKRINQHMGWGRLEYDLWHARAGRALSMVTRRRRVALMDRNERDLGRWYSHGTGSSTDCCPVSLVSVLGSRDLTGGPQPGGALRLQVSPKVEASTRRTVGEQRRLTLSRPEYKTGGRRVLSGGGGADHEVTPQAPSTGSGCREHSSGGFGGGHPRFLPAVREVDLMLLAGSIAHTG